MKRDVKAILDGALGGVLGTAGMSALMVAAGKAGLLGEHPPDKIAGAALDAVGIHAPNEKAQDAVASVLHLGFGMGCGALFALLHRHRAIRISGAPHGMFFASIIWAISYQGWVPALGIMPPASKDRPDRPLVMFLAHLVYGAILGAFVGRRTPPDEEIDS